METKSMSVATVQDDIRGELSDVCVANLDANLRLLEANDDFLNRLGRSASEVYGQQFGDFIHSSVRDVIMGHLGRLADGSRLRFNARFVGVRWSSTRFSGRMTGLAVRGDDGKVATIVLLINPDLGVEPLWSSAKKRRPLSELDALVLEGVAAGSSTVQLAARLYLSRQGVEYHVGAMLRRFKCANRSALVAKAYTQGILTMGQWPPKVTAEYVR
jgi:DNA-binding CsgD family transcriptional regulator